MFPQRLELNTSIPALMVSIRLYWCQSLFTICLCCPVASCPLRESQIWVSPLLFIIHVVNLTSSQIKLWLFFCYPGAFHTFQPPDSIIAAALCSYPSIQWWVDSCTLSLFSGETDTLSASSLLTQFYFYSVVHVSSWESLGNYNNVYLFHPSSDLFQYLLKTWCCMFVFITQENDNTSQ